MRPVSSFLLSVLLLVGASSAAACPSDFDIFGNGGFANSPAGLYGWASDAVIGPGGSVYAATLLAQGSAGLVRYTEAGQPDESFGSGGIARLAVRGYFQYLAVQADGSVVAAGQIILPAKKPGGLTIPAVLVARFDESGQIDPGFGDGGYTVTELGEHAFPYGMIVRSDGAVVVVGETWTQDDGTNPFVFFYSASGELTHMQTSLADVRPGWATSVVEVANRAVVVVGVDRGTTGYRTFLTRFREDGLPDPAFGNGGTRLYPVPRLSEQAWAIARDADGRLYVSSGAKPIDKLRQKRVRVRRFFDNGDRDSSYGNRGKALLRFYWWTESRDLHVAANGEATLAGYEPGKDGAGFVARLTAEGKRDRTFGYYGIDWFYGGPAYAVDVGSDGKIVAAGVFAFHPYVMRLVGGEWDGVGACVPRCGNGTLDLHEQCDDGNTDNGDGCSAACLVEKL